MDHVFDGLSGCDGSHRGVTDWYEDKEAALISAINSINDFTTDWYSSKHQIAAARITRVGNEYTCEVSVSDDLDTYGLGISTFEDKGEGIAASVIRRIEDHLDKASELADSDQRSNRVYCGYCVGRPDGAGGRSNWIWTYIKPIGDAVMYDFPEPPGDAYHEWGWEYGGINPGEDEISQDDKEKMEEWINNDSGEGITQIGRWIVEAWDHE